jgi:hypothetical protein
MNKESTPLQRISILIFFIGFLVGMLLLGIAVVGDFEGYVFYPTLMGDSVLTTLDCPVIMDSSEVGTITATMQNPSEKRITPTVWTHISEGFVTLVREDRVNLELEPGESQQVQWTVTEDDAAYDYWVLVKVYVYSQHPLPSSQGSCGVFVTDLKGFTGVQVYVFAFAISVLFMGVGTGIWFATNRPLRGKAVIDRTRTLVIMGAVVLLGLISTFIGSYLWIVGAVLLIIGVLLILIYLMR